jgi:hypothetical protein
MIRDDNALSLEAIRWRGWACCFWYSVRGRRWLFGINTPQNGVIVKGERSRAIDCAFERMSGVPSHSAPNRVLLYRSTLRAQPY